MHITSFMRTILYKGSFAAKGLSRKTIMTTPAKLQEVMDGVKTNPYYSKYEEKITKLQQSQPEEFTSRIGSIVKIKTKKEEEVNPRQFSQLLNPKEKVSRKSQTKEELLDKIMKTDLIKDKSAEEITQIWQSYHIQKDCIAATISAEEFEKLEETSNKYPTFLFPLPRSQGYEFVLCQFEKNTVHFTPLLYYQVHKENSPECLTIVHYKEFKDNKGIVLMRGEFDKNIINTKEAQCLANQLKLYYVQADEEKRKLLDIFTRTPDSFDHMDLVKQINSLSL